MIKESSLRRSAKAYGNLGRENSFLVLFVALFFIVMFLLLTSPALHAQEPYVPPPLFGAPNFPPPKDPAVRKNVPKMPPISKPVTVEPYTQEIVEPEIVIEPVIKPEVKPEVKSDTGQRKVTIEKIPQEKANPPPVKTEPKRPIIKPKPKPVRKESSIEKEPAIEIEKLEVIPGPEPIDLLNEIEGEIIELEDAPQIQTPPEAPQKIEIKKPQSSTGNIKGAKTMPSVKKQDVESEILFEPQEDKPNLMERLKSKIVKPEEENQVEEEIILEEIDNKEIIDLSLPSEPSASDKSSLPDVETLEDGRRKIVMAYDDLQMDMSQAHKDVLDQLVLPALDANGETLLKIQAFASPQSGSLSADRRIALSRALAIREYLVEQEIISPRIDVRSLGAQTDILPLDRVELYIVE
jgi:outer membrane protein OmpA-like peptidoglycan-associated protein